MHHRGVERTHRDDRDSDHAVLRVEDDDPEPLHGTGTILRQEVRRELSGATELGSLCRCPHQRAAPELDGRKDLCGACAPDTSHATKLPGTNTRQTMQAAGALYEPVRHLEHVDMTGPAPKDEREELVVAESGDAQPFEFLAGPIVRQNSFHRYTQSLMRRLLPFACAVAALIFSGCAEPPHKEMDQAQGAIDAARAAGGELYAATEYAAATAALKSANDAVAGGDYRLALNYALESSEHAQNAAREAANTKAQVRAEVERRMTEIVALLAQANTRMTAAQRARVPQRRLQGPTNEVAAANAAVQKAGEAINADDYLTARETLEGVKERIEQALAAINEVSPPPGARRRG